MAPSLAAVEVWPLVGEVAMSFRFLNPWTGRYRVAAQGRSDTGYCSSLLASAIHLPPPPNAASPCPAGVCLTLDSQFRTNAYLRCMLKAFEFCIPIAGTKVPAGPEWLHEIKYGFRLRVERDGDRVRLITRGGYDWTER
jgi:hypothetical protein